MLRTYYNTNSKNADQDENNYNKISVEEVLIII